MSEYGAVLAHFDVAQIAIYVFWLFFASLIYFLRREDHREGYPLVVDYPGQVEHGFPPLPEPKSFLLGDGHVVLAPRSEPPEAIPGVQAMPFAGAPYIATGNPMIDGLGPAAYAMRSDHPELAYDDGLPKIVPLRAAADFYLAYEDTDPRGFAVLGADGIIAGTIVDTWIDRSEYIARFLELELDPAIGIGRRILPLSYAQIRAKEGAIKVKAILGAQFADVPVLRDPDTVTPREEDRITAYYASGFLYATALRAAPLL